MFVMFFYQLKVIAKLGKQVSVTKADLNWKLNK